MQCGYWSVFWPQCQHLKVMRGIEFWFLVWFFCQFLGFLGFFGAFFWLLDQYMSKFNLCKSYAHYELFWLKYGCLLTCYMLLLISNKKDLELRNKLLNKSHLCWTEFHSATFPIFSASYRLCKYIRTKFVMHQLLKWHFLCPNNHGVSIRVPNLKQSPL